MRDMAALLRLRDPHVRASLRHNRHGPRSRLNSPLALGRQTLITSGWGHNGGWSRPGWLGSSEASPQKIALTPSQQTKNQQDMQVCRRAALIEGRFVLSSQTPYDSTEGLHTSRRRQIWGLAALDPSHPHLIALLRVLRALRGHVSRLLY